MPEQFIQKAAELLLKNDIGIGIKAGYYYPDLWSRDALISCLGLCASGDERLIEIARASVDTLSGAQKFTGQIPNKVSPDLKKVCFGEGGCVDSSLWYPIAALEIYNATKDKDFLAAHSKKIDRAMVWAIGLDQNNDWLIETNEGSGWSDVLVRSGRVLYDNAVLYKALKSADEARKIIGKEERWGWIAENTKEAMNLFFWPTKDNLERIRSEHCFSGVSMDMETVMHSYCKDPEYYIADLGFRKYDPRFETLGNLLAVLFGVADRSKSRSIISYIEREGVARPYPIKSLNPVISKGDPFWSFYFRWSELPFLQEPGNYHNGGIWPFIGGFYVAALKKSGLPFQRVFDKLAESCALGGWRFSEWLNANGEPQGSAEQSWSAAMLLYSNYFGHKYRL
jgi:glycogen debranching enzyme